MSTRGIYYHMYQYHPIFLEKYWANLRPGLEGWNYLIAPRSGTGKWLYPIDQLVEEHMKLHLNINDFIMAQREIDHDHPFPEEEA